MSLPGPAINPSLLQTPMFRYYLPSLCVGHTNLRSVALTLILTWLVQFYFDYTFTYWG